MPKITVLPHEELCPAGQGIRGRARRSHWPMRCSITVSTSNTRAARWPHARPAIASCARASTSLPPAEDKEEDLLDRAWGLTPVSRLSCQAIVQDADLTVEIPKYSINYAKEKH